MIMSNSTLPAVTSAPPATVFFDGVCGMCNESVDFIIRRDTQRRFRFAPLQGSTAAERLQVPPERLLKSIVLEDQSGQHFRSDAIWRILVGLGGLWAVAGRALWLIPRPVRNWGYDFIGERRYRIFGKKETCRLPSEEEVALFLP